MIDRDLAELGFIQSMNSPGGKLIDNISKRTFLSFSLSRYPDK
jgi:hypothetical protein